MSAVQHLPAGTTEHKRHFALDLWLLPTTLPGIIPLLFLLRSGIANTSDGMVRILRTVRVVELMQAGMLYPQWASAPLPQPAAPTP